MTVHLTHWGAFEAVSDGERLTGVRPWRGDPEPVPLIGNVASAQHHPARITQPHVRKGWLEGGPGAPGRGDEPFVPVSWDTALGLLSGELRRVYRDHGAEAVYGGSYGWASAGRFHHAQSQVHRFLNCLGGYVRHVNSYSLGTSTVLLPYVIADVTVLQTHATGKSVIAEHTGLVVAFGGLSPKNAAVSPGGVSRHHTRGWMSAARARGCRFVSVSPLRDDTPAAAQAEWIAPRPGTDAALMLALAQVLDADGLADAGFLDRYTVGFSRFARYLRGEADGVVKDPAWASAITGVPATRIRELAHEMAAWRDHGDGQLVAAAGPARGAAAVARRGARGHARPDRAAGRRLRPRVWLHGHGRRAGAPGRGAGAAAGAERGFRVHPGGPDRRHAAESRCLL